MGNEIRVTGAIRLEQPDATNFIERKFTGETIDQTADPTVWTQAVQNIVATGEGEALALGDVTLITLGWAFFYNHHASITVEVGDVPVATFVPFLSLKAGEFSGPMRLSQNITALQAKAASSTVNLEYLLIAD